MSSWCLSCIPRITRSTKDDGAIFLVQLQCLSHSQCSLLNSYNTESLVWTSQQVNAVELGCVCVCANQEKQETSKAVAMWVHQKWKDCNTRTLRLDFWVDSVHQCISNCQLWVDFRNAVWDLIQTMGLFLVCHTCYMHTSILSCCRHASASGNRDCLTLIKTTNSQDMICFRHMYWCGNLQMYRNTPATYLFHCDVFLLRTDKKQRYN